MGRKRVNDLDKKIPIKLSISKKYILELKSRDINISQLFEEFVKTYLKR